MFQRAKDKRTGEVVELRLVIDVISRDAPDWLCFWISKTELRGYLLRSEGFDIYEIAGISPDVIDDVRRAKLLRVIERDEDDEMVRWCEVPSVAGNEPGWWDRAGVWCRKQRARMSLFGTYVWAVFFDR
jgi:hypothetical protein